MLDDNMYNDMLYEINLFLSHHDRQRIRTVSKKYDEVHKKITYNNKTQQFLDRIYELNFKFNKNMIADVVNSGELELMSLYYDVGNIFSKTLNYKFGT
jgi:hypothetical protein